MSRAHPGPPAAPVIVCVDDDPDALALTTGWLRQGGFTVIATLSAREALRVLATQPVAVLVSDYEMPEMTGVEVAVSARTLQPNTVRLLLTGRATLDTAVTGINDGEIFRFLTKPIDPAALRHAVAAAVLRNAELVAHAHDRDASSRRDHLLAELETEYPAITQVARDPDGTYRIAGDPWARLDDPGLAKLRPTR